MDLRDASLVVSDSEIHDYIDFAAKEKSFVQNKKIAFLTSKPSEVVVGVLFSRKSKILPVILDVFSTLGASFSFLDIEEESSRDEITQVINNLKVINTHY